MPFVPLHEYFPKIAWREVRSVTVPPDSALGLPPDEYGFIEMYCDEPGCDCRRVLFYVVAKGRMGVQAVVGWGWEDLDFYRQWMKYGDPADPIELKGPSLNLASPTTSLAPALVALVRDVLLKDAGYVERIKRHYQMVRENVDRPRRQRKRKLKKRR